ncbi:MAG: dTDP-4-dehydrorhamnose 3,5-epimerase [Hyphomonas sp.]|uniref:dTDP-4-dehydrorhamnose 3,5-epimerase n=1 Tax=Hyphomonas sp. TaxID=87 RepID=UPI0025BCE1F1|nr:dTDP-4-dehydrorhamnose 3,5-epimerase [Hyphomonas sp.]MBA4339504.1 dTDP-4-dehydrorhamnose 3,5-epimerase [Hyphomonas sp.]
MKFHPTTLKDAVLIDLERRGDDRGFFARTFCADEFAANGLPTEFVQQNMSYSATKGTIRGMHFQRAPHAEDKLIRCLRGAIVDIILDLRPDSPTYKRWEAFVLNEENKRQLLVPKGFAHGFQTVSDHVEVTYLVSSRYNGAAEGGVRWNDPAFGITWPLAPTEMSDKDKKWADFAD